MALIAAPLACILVLLSCVPARAEDTDRRSPARQQPHIRTNETRLRALVDEGQRHSETFRALVTRLEQSDLVVYLEYEHWIWQPRRLLGRLTFLSSAAGIRYVLVRLRCLPRPVDELALLAHELQHAVEIADHPDVVDEASMARAYLQIGVVVGSTASNIAFDTSAAVEAGAVVTREVRQAARGETAADTPAWREARSARCGDRTPAITIAGMGR